MKKIIIIGIALLAGLSTYAQQEAMFTHYMFNTLAINPAYAGSRDALTVTALHRSQWVGFEGAPTTQTLTLHAPVMNEKIGLGLSVFNDKIGPLNTTAIYADFAYKIKVSEKGKLAFGLKGGINLLQGDLNTLQLEDGSDESFTNNIESDMLPNFGFGMYYSTSKWYVGLSTPKLLENTFGDNTSTTSTQVATEQRHYFLIAGTVFNLNKDGSLKLKPTTFVKVTNGAPLEADLTGMVIIKDKIELGAMFRTGDAAGLLVGYNFTEQLRFGYSFDWSYSNETFKYNNGSHEVMLRYDFIFKGKEKIRSPRYF
ncbi:MAG: type IX secretion system membrane protein PorP/SprF [Vicingaceae bacterium]|nr:type IX secretion system membrane protein PorP/SprF [Vicingaceae bacterium]